jgi:membrane fusion protein (multidrug efflux system)
MLHRPGRQRPPPRAAGPSRSGNVVPYQSATLYAKVAGYLKRITVDKGDHVRAGQLIAEVEVPELIAERTQYKAEVDVAQAEYDRVRDAIKQAPDLVVPQTVDEARGKLEVAQAQLQRTDTLLKYANIVAPFSGTVTARYVDPGAFISQATNGTQQNSAVVTVMDFHRVRIQVPVPEGNALSVVKGTKAIISAQGIPGREFQGSVTRISYALDPTAKTMLAEIEMDNPNELLRPGMYVSVELMVGDKTASASPPANSGSLVPALAVAK